MAVAAGISIAFLFNDRGLISWYRYTQEKNRIEAARDSLKEEGVRLREEIEKLKFVPEYMEKLAREKYGMAKKGEKVYKVVPEGDNITKE